MVLLVVLPLAEPLTEEPEGVEVVAAVSGVVVVVVDEVVLDGAGAAGVTTVVEDDGVVVFSTVVEEVEAGRSQPVAKAAVRARAAATGMSFMTSP